MVNNFCVSLFRIQMVEMDRKQFIGAMLGGGAIVGLSSLKWLADMPEEDTKMPVLFVGHGSPMNAIEDTIFSQTWRGLSGKMQKPKAIVCVSAHWLTNGTWVTAVENPTTIHDFGGFPQALFDVQYPAPGSPELAAEMQQLFPKDLLHLDMEWGLDHGTWSVLKHIFPLADVPVVQLSIDYGKPTSYHFGLAQYLKSLRKKGVLVVASGNMVHNLRMVAWDRLNEVNFGFDWAIESNEAMKKAILDRNFEALQKYESLSKGAKLAIPTPDHYYPLMYALGLADENESITLFNDYLVAGSLTMTSVAIGMG